MCQRTLTGPERALGPARALTLDAVNNIGNLYSTQGRLEDTETFLRTLVVIHPDSAYLEDIRSLKGYTCEELNVRDLVPSTDEAKYNVQYSVMADWSTLGKKLKKDVVRVRKALSTLTSDQVKKFVQDKTITLEGINQFRGTAKL
ncbi:hypothetical protein GP486_001690 [Trichoglossum hirsutum]|uniref:Tetratricopeptide repeat protein n=1 Tax=Trichoglossum hirsutum TaxID=265104 RepID=A0A9P8LGJ6_9PEZI|nr:hypothetical protein GP486_001690 [Trichoglossum hirsutum]